MKAYDLTNQRFGRLIALYKCNYKKGNKYPWHCICDCGEYKDVPTQDLITGKIQSCGCLRKENASKLGKRTIKNAKQSQFQNLVGQRFGRLTIIEVDKIENRLQYWKCQCDCGSITLVPTHSLKSGNTMSCGCLRSKGQERISKLLTQNNIPFLTEKAFSNCKYPDTKYQPIFDFYVNNQYVIEYDGIQHFKEISYFQLSLEEQKYKDQFKNQWCKDNNIPLIRIPYTQINNLSIEDLLLKTSKFIVN